MEEAANDSYDGKILYNELVMIALIEQEYIKAELSSKNDDSKYIKFLQTLLRSKKRVKLQEACCRQIIKFFEKRDEEHNLAHKDCKDE